MRMKKGSRSPGKQVVGERSFADETSEVERKGEDVTEDSGLGGIVEAEEGGTFEIAAGLIGVASFGVRKSTHTQVPGRGIDFLVASETEGTIREV